MRILYVFLLTVALWAQSPPRVEFEVASVKASPASADPSVQVGVHVDGSQIHMNRFALKDLIRIAYRVKLFQVSGPEWMAGERFDIDAKLPAGIVRDQVPEMLQSLLADRFQLKVHRESREFSVYGLVVMPGGVKLQPVPEDPVDSTDPARNAVQVTASGGPTGVNINFGPGSYFRFGDNKLEGKKLSMLNFADTLARFTDRPVVDMTQLPGRYDLSVDLTEDDYRAMLIRSAISAGVNLPPQALRLLDSSDGSLFSALKPLGLKLEGRKAPLEVLVVDNILRTPTEN